MAHQVLAGSGNGACETVIGGDSAKDPYVDSTTSA